MSGKHLRKFHLRKKTLKQNTIEQRMFEWKAFIRRNRLTKEGLSKSFKNSKSWSNIIFKVKNNFEVDKI